MIDAGCRAWAKLELDGNGRVVRWLSVEEHAADVAAVCEVLLRRSLIRRRLARLGEVEDLDPVACERLCVLSALHDVGKYNRGFQNRKDPRLQPQGGHVRELVRLFDWDGPERQEFGRAVGYERIESWCADSAAAADLLLATFCHHGRPVSPGEVVRLCASVWHANADDSPFEQVRKLRAATARWYPSAWGDAVGQLPATPAFQHAWNGLVTLADWVGSDTRFFPLLPPGGGNERTADLRIEESRRTAAAAVAAIGLDPTPAREALGSSEPGFERVSPFVPRPEQLAVLGIPQRTAGSIAVLEASTGSGKTEAAVGHFLRLFQAGLVDGMYFALPTRTAATQIHRRLVDAMARAFDDAAVRPPVVLAVPGYLTVDDREGCRLAPFEVQWPDDQSERLRYRGWAAETPKRYLAGAVVVGTIDQVLLSSLAVSHAGLRATALLRHLLVVDEVHASDAYMNRILEDVLRRHEAAGGHALLMSATLAGATRARLLSPGRSVVVPSMAHAQAEPFPRLEVRSPGVQDYLAKLPAGDDRSVEVSLVPEMAEPAAIAARAYRAARRDARVLVVRNTVRGCLEVQAAVEALATAEEQSHLLFRCAGRPAPHHSRFAPDDRRLLDAALERTLGKERTTRGCVVVATQTVQQSLDIDADLLLTDLCPMDVLLQRLGRLHRHRSTARPRGFEQLLVDVLVPSGRDLADWIDATGEARGPHGLGSVYVDLRVIEATWRTLEKEPVLHLPSGCRGLVEQSLHPERLAELVSELGGRWQAHALKAWGAEANQRQTARYQLAKREHPFGDDRSLFPADELDRRIRTRLGEDDRRVTLEPPAPGPFGQIVRELTIPAHMAKGLAVPEVVTAASDGDGGLRFDLADRRFVYDRWGLRRATDEAARNGLKAVLACAEEQTNVE